MEAPTQIKKDIWKNYSKIYQDKMKTLGDIEKKRGIKLGNPKMLITTYLKRNGFANLARILRRKCQK